MHTWGRFIYGDVDMTAKPFKTIEEQLKLLRDRGLIIDDEDKAKTFLYHNNYYRISGYSLTLRQKDVFYDSVSFQDIIDIYEFDHEFRHILLKYLLTIEIQIKSIYAYEFTKIHEPTDYLKEELFSDKNRYADLMKRAEAQKTKRLNQEIYLKHFEQRHEELPLWVYVDLFSMGDISILYSTSEAAIQNTVACAYGLDRRFGPSVLKKNLHSMTIIRNLCAHGNRLYGRVFSQKPNLSKGEKALLRKNEKGELDNAHLYGYFLVLKRLLPAEKFDALKASLILLLDKYSKIRMNAYGFRDDWQEKL